MTDELYWLSLTLTATVFFWVPYVLNRMAIRGLQGTMANPSPQDPPLAPWAERARRAHVNALESLVLFAPAVLAVHALDLGDSLTAVACELYFFSRLTHYIVYAAGIPVVRTFAYFGGIAGIVILLVRLLGAM